ncbi:uncharacterized protein BJ171DRAFT_518570 [Polychytrium aggregatum]|uniref:uncharacterized protein n=1 Tax=Polychytrium aggregatum TaxID=110093 RepID=UPI0022FEB01F|nr:uncharacterized protein BJ171DRAFT_518570 [Polychytrium aggregatum]KAI9199503.1 hypothetical protein BJ171DRAFT_518570 [Polychytrium aggregatum]
MSLLSAACLRLVCLGIQASRPAGLLSARRISSSALLCRQGPFKNSFDPFPFGAPSSREAADGAPKKQRGPRKKKTKAASSAESKESQEIASSIAAEFSSSGGFASAYNLRPVSPPDFPGFEEALNAENASISFAKFRDVIEDPTESARLNNEHLSRLIYVMCRRGSPNVHQLVDVLVWMESRKIQPTLADFNEVLFCCARESEKVVAGQILDRMIAMGLRPNVATYNAFLTLHFQSSQPAAAFDFYNKMKHEGIEQDEETLRIMIRGCTQNKLYAEAEQYHAVLEESGVPISGKTFSALISLYEAQGKFDQVERCFEQSLQSGEAMNQQLASKMILIYNQQGASEKARRVFEALLQAGVVPDLLTWSVLIQSHLGAGDADAAAAALNQMIEKGLQPDAIMYAGLIEGFCKCGRLDEALQLELNMRAAGLRVIPKITKSLVLAYFAAKEPIEASRCVEQLKADGFKLSAEMFQILFEGFGECFEVNFLKQYWEEMKRTMPKVTADLYQAAITAFLRTQSLAQANTLTHEMVEAGFQPTLQTFTRLVEGQIIRADYLGAGSTLRLLRVSKHSHANVANLIAVHQAQFEKTIPALIAAKSNDRSDSLETAILIYKELLIAKIPMKEETYQSVMAAHIESKNLVDVVRTWSSLEAQGIQPQAKSVSLLIRSVVDLGQEKTATALFSMIEKKQYSMDEETYQTLILLAAKYGRSELIHYTVDLLNRGHRVTPSLFKSVEQRLKDGGYKTLLKNYTELIDEIDPAALDDPIDDDAEEPDALSGTAQPH